MKKAAFILVGLGVAVYGFLAYQVAMVGGLTETATRSSCAEAATGVGNALYRLAENITIERTWMPLSASCVWSGGSSAVLVPVTLWSWLGPVLVLAGSLIGLANWLRRRRPRRRLA